MEVEGHLYASKRLIAVHVYIISMNGIPCYGRQCSYELLVLTQWCLLTLRIKNSNYSFTSVITIIL